jgi:hypothetical protein
MRRLGSCIVMIMEVVIVSMFSMLGVVIVGGVGMTFFFGLVAFLYIILSSFFLGYW